METVERHVTLPRRRRARPGSCSPDPTTWPPGWAARSPSIPTPGAAGTVVDHDGTRRHLVVDEVEPGRRLAWRWWTDDDDRRRSRVEITLDAGGRRHRGARRRAAARRRQRASARPGQRRPPRGVVAPAPAPRGAARWSPPPSGGERDPAADAEAAPGAVFEALADPTRRAVLRDVAEQGPRTATELAADLPVTRQAVAKHLAVLREAGLVAPARTGRETRFTATLAPAGRRRPLARPHRPGLGGPLRPARGARREASRRPTRPDGRRSPLRAEATVGCRGVRAAGARVPGGADRRALRHRAGRRQHRRPRDDRPAHRRSASLGRLAGQVRRRQRALPPPAHHPRRAGCPRARSSTARSCCSPAR